MEQQTPSIEDVLKLAEKIEEWKPIGSGNWPFYYGCFPGSKIDRYLRITIQPNLFSRLRKNLRSVNIEVDFTGDSFVEANLCKYDNIRERAAIELYSAARENASRIHKEKEEKSRSQGLKYLQDILTQKD